MLNISPSLLLFEIIVFLVLLSILNSMFFKPILKHIDNRKASLDNDLHSASENLSDIDSYEKEAHSIILDAKKEAHKIIEQALTEAKKESALKIDAKKAELSKQKEIFMQELNTKEAKLKEVLLKQMPEYIKITENKILNRGI